MSIRAVFVLAACLQVALANPFHGYHHAPPPCVKYVDVPVPILEQVNVPVPSPVPVPVLAPTITETWTRLAGTTSGNGAEQKVLTTSAPAPPVALPLPSAPAAAPCGGPLAGAELIFNANAPALALGASPLALNGGLPYNGLIGAGHGAPFAAEIVAPAAGYGYGFDAGYGYAPAAGFGYGPAAGFGYGPAAGFGGFGAGFGHGAPVAAGAPVEVLNTPSFAAPGCNGLVGSIVNPAVVGNNPLGHGYHGHGWW